MDFEKYCISVGYAPNTTARNIRFVKTFVDTLNQTVKRIIN
jgi:hypothetical protein